MTMPKLNPRRLKSLLVLKPISLAKSTYKLERIKYSVFQSFLSRVGSICCYLRLKSDRADKELLFFRGKFAPLKTE